jgi:exodeoxyribonuclease VII small subunit
MDEPMPTKGSRPDESSRPDRDGGEPPALTYEAALRELEQLVSELESGQLPLDQLLVSYQRGAQLLAFCRDRLAAVESQVKVLEGAELRPWVGP